MAIVTKKKLEAQKKGLDSFVDNAKASAAEQISVQSKAGRKQKADKAEWGRQTFIIRNYHLQLIKEAAYWDRMEQKDVLDDALATYFAGKERRPLPE